MSDAWREQKERGTPFALNVILWIAQNMGRGFARLFLYPITAYFFLFASAQRKASQSYLRRVLGREPTALDVARHIFTFAATILDRIFLLSDRHDMFDVQINNEEILHKLQEKHQGCLLLGSHLGSFEIMRTVGIKRFPVKVLMHHDHNENITMVLESLNPEIVESIIPLGETDTLLKVKEALDNAYLVGLLGDRVAENDKPVTVEFLGDETIFPAGPFQLAARLKVPVILFFGIYRGGNRYEIFFETLGDPLVPLQFTEEQDLDWWVKQYVSRLEYFTREAPNNWFNFYEFWPNKKTDH